MQLEIRDVIYIFSPPVNPLTNRTRENATFFPPKRKNPFSSMETTSPCCSIFVTMRHNFHFQFNLKSTKAECIGPNEFWEKIQFVNFVFLVRKGELSERSAIRTEEGKQQGKFTKLILRVVLFRLNVLNSISAKQNKSSKYYLAEIYRHRIWPRSTDNKNI